MGHSSATGLGAEPRLAPVVHTATSSVVGWTVEPTAAAGASPEAAAHALASAVAHFAARAERHRDARFLVLPITSALVSDGPARSVLGRAVEDHRSVAARLVVELAVDDVDVAQIRMFETFTDRAGLQTAARSARLSRRADAIGEFARLHHVRCRTIASEHSTAASLDTAVMQTLARHGTPTILEDVHTPESLTVWRRSGGVMAQGSLFGEATAVPLEHVAARPLPSIRDPDDLEVERIDVLRRLGVLDSPTERMFDHLVEHAAEVCDAPIALISLVDVDRQWFKAAHGLDVRETPRAHSVCQYTIRSVLPMVVEDALLDERIRDSPLVQGPPFLRAYLGAPIVLRTGHALGTVCVLDREPRGFERRQVRTVTWMADLVARALDARLPPAERD